MRYSCSAVLVCIHLSDSPIYLPINPPFFGLYVDDGYCRQKKSQSDHVLESLNSFHQNLKFTDEKEPPRFLDTKISRNLETGHVELGVFHKANNLPTHWSSQTPRRYKRNAIVCELHRAFSISDDFEKEVLSIRDRFSKAGFPKGFVNDTIENFKFKKFDEIIPPFFFDVPEEKREFRLPLPYCRKNENLAKTFLRKLSSFTDNKTKVFIIWNTTKIKTLFPLKDRNQHPSCTIYEGTCSCGAKYIGE